MIGRERRTFVYFYFESEKGVASGIIVVIISFSFKKGSYSVIYTGVWCGVVSFKVNIPVFQ